MVRYVLWKELTVLLCHQMKNAHVIVYGLFVTSVTIHIHTATITNKILTTRVFEIISAILYIETTNVPVNNMESFQSNGMGIGIIYWGRQLNGLLYHYSLSDTFNFY